MAKKKANKKISMVVIGIIILIMALFGLEEAFLNENANTANTINTVHTAQPSENIQQNETIIPEGNLKVYFIDVGQADSILITTGNQAMLIDAGNNDDGEMVVEFIKDKNIETLNYVIATHPHEDHIGGLDDVINNFNIENLYMPNVQTTTKTFEDVLTAVQNRGLKIKSPEVGYKFNMGEANVEVMSADVNEDNLNLSSIVLRMQFGEKSFLFMGDSEEENEVARNWPETTVLKVGHHGSDTSSSQNFLNQVKPEYAIIMVGKGNSYGHPKQEIINRLESLNCKIYRTDTNGTITVTTDGKELDITTEK